MRLDKFVAQSVNVTRSQAKKLIVTRRITINDHKVVHPAYKVEAGDTVLFDDKSLQLPGFHYILLHKPAGYICSTKDEEYPSALNLLDVPNNAKLHFAGRLDQDTTGLVLISDDGQWTHRVTSPRKQLGKCYRVWLKAPITLNMIEEIEAGILLNNESRKTQPAAITQVTENEVLLTIYEGKYHQVKRMFAAVGNHVERLHRESIGTITLEGLAEGESRNLLASEVAEY